VRGEQETTTEPTTQPKKAIRRTPNINIWVKNKNNTNKLFLEMH
jgi:hypothetical protein